MKLPINTQWVVATVSEPTMFHQTSDEAWLLNPNRRYIFNANRLQPIEHLLADVSEFENSSLYCRLRAGQSLCGSKILIERTRERGIGDLLFMTGVLGYLNHITGNNVEIDLMSFADRGVVLTHSPLLNNSCVKCGPVEYDSLRHYNYHWFVNSLTEQDAEPDQLNVYDALYTQLGFDPAEIDAKWKRPAVTMAPQDYQNLDMLYRRIWDDRKLELRRIGYYVVAPFSNASLRCMPYTCWLETIKHLSARRPVVVVGTSSLRLPETSDMSAGDFISRMSGMGPAVVNAIDSTSTRVLMALIARSNGLVALDSAPLYIAQALNIPAVSVWGTHAPGARIGYDKAYTDLAVWKPDACRRAPCFAYSQFPTHKCPNGEHQRTCAVLEAVTAEDIMAKIELVESFKK